MDNVSLLVKRMFGTYQAFAGGKALPLDTQTLSQVSHVRATSESNYCNDLASLKEILQANK